MGCSDGANPPSRCGKTGALTTHSDGVRLRLSTVPTGLCIISNGLARKVDIWESRTGKVITSLRDPTGIVHGGGAGGPLSWHPDGTRIAVCWGENIHIGDAVDHELLIVCAEASAVVRHVRIIVALCLVRTEGAERLVRRAEQCRFGIQARARNY